MQQNKPLRTVGGGLNVTPNDGRDFILGALFPPISIEQVPDTDFL